MSPELYLAYVLSCALVVVVPGPTVTVVIANSLTHGTRAGLSNVAGTQFGIALMLGVLLVGLASIIETIGWWFDWVRLFGAAYLIWLGAKLLRSSGTLRRDNASPAPPRGGFFLQGFLVIMSNPKALLFFGAFIPQFVDPAGDYVWQVAFLGVTFMVVATVFDGAYAVVAGRASSRFLSSRRVRSVSRVSGLFLVGGGIWLALTRGR